MGLQSALSTALTGLNAAETTIDVVGNNVANSQTVGFKESQAVFATQFLQTLSIGSAPNTAQGGTNPRQIGLGTKVAEISPEFSQGTIEISANPLDLAIQGDGFFIVQGEGGEPLYTRNGQFKTNSNNEIVSINGQRLLGYGVDDNFEIQPTGLVPITIPLGQAAVAQATENVFFEGNLRPPPPGSGDPAPAIIQSDILSDGSKEIPPDQVTLSSLAKPVETTTTAVGGAGAVGAGNYSYRIAFIDADGNEGPASNPTSTLTVAGPADSIDLSNLPEADGVNFVSRRLYRANADTDGIFREVTTLGALGTTFNDTANDAALGTDLNTDGLQSGSYSYYVTYYSSVSGLESRPTSVIGPITADENVSPRIRLENLPAPASSDFDGIRIYRNLSTDAGSFFRVGEMAPGSLQATFIDDMPDSVAIGQEPVDLEGPGIFFGLPLTDLVRREGANYINVFQEGELTFTGSKGPGGRDLAPKEFTITSATTVQDLITFMEQSMGVIKSASEPTFPPAPGAQYGGTVSDSRIQFISNMGVENALDIGLSAFQLSVGGAPAEAIQLPFTNVQDAVGEGASADFIVYDSLGMSLSVRVSTVVEQTPNDSNSTTVRWIAESPDNQPTVGNTTNVGTGVLTFDGEGNLISVSNDQVIIERNEVASASPLVFDLQFASVTGLAPDSPSELNVNLQDGFPPGTLSSFIITESGKIQGVFTNGSSRDLGQLRMARFANNNGLEQIGDNLFATGVNSGLPIESNPGSQGVGTITAGAVELSNTDIGQNLIELILASTQYRGGARVITAVQQLLDELLAIRR